MDGDDDFELEDALLDAIQDAPALPQEDPESNAAAIDSFLEEDALLDAIQGAPALPQQDENYEVQPLASENCDDLELATEEDTLTAPIGNSVVEAKTVSEAIAAAAQEADDEFDRLCEQLTTPGGIDPAMSRTQKAPGGLTKAAVAEKMPVSQQPQAAAPSGAKLQGGKSTKRPEKTPKAPGKPGLPWRGVLFICCAMVLFWLPSLWAEDEVKEAFVVREPRIVAPRINDESDMDFANVNATPTKRGSIGIQFGGSTVALNMTDEPQDVNATMEDDSEASLPEDLRQKKALDSRRPGGGQRRKGRSSGAGVGNG